MATDSSPFGLLARGHPPAYVVRGVVSEVHHVPLLDSTFRPLVDGPTAREHDRTILVYGTLPPARLRLRPWFRDRRLKKMVEGAAQPATRSPGLVKREGEPA